MTAHTSVLDGQYVSLWLEQALARERPASSEQQRLPASADVVIVGGGFTGLWTAIRLLEHDPELSVCVRESR